MHQCESYTHKTPYMRQQIAVLFFEVNALASQRISMPCRKNSAHLYFCPGSMSAHSNDRTAVESYNRAQNPGYALPWTLTHTHTHKKKSLNICLATVYNLWYILYGTMAKLLTFKGNHSVAWTQKAKKLNLEDRVTSKYSVTTVISF